MRGVIRERYIISSMRDQIVPQIRWEDSFGCEIEQWLANCINKISDIIFSNIKNSEYVNKYVILHILK